MSLGLPYMGSKRKLAPAIVDKILFDYPDTKHVYDLFGGGGAISFEFAKRGLDVTYNELNSAVVALLRDVMENGITDKYYQWVSREMFDAHKVGNDWMGGFCQCIWSFGNSQKSYLFGNDIEPLKKLGHEVIVDKNENSLMALSKLLGIEIPIEVMHRETVNDRRLAFRLFLSRCQNRFDLEQLERLEQLQRLGKKFTILNGSYADVKIETPIDSTVIYLDPPYENTAKYKECLIHSELKAWIDASPYTIYLSSYEYDMPCVLEMEHRSTLSATKNDKKVIEKLFCNKPKHDLRQQDFFKNIG